jgi:hypothetical protein
MPSFDNASACSSDLTAAKMFAPLSAGLLLLRKSAIREPPLCGVNYYEAYVGPMGALHVASGAGD